VGIKGSGRPRSPTIDRWGALVLPALVFLVVFFLAPLVTMSFRSITDPSDAGLSNYTAFFAQEANLRALRNTFWIAFISTLT
jgi:putative spermidine/putrescine transport system permease protein